MQEVFERERPFLRGLAYRMLGAASEADDILQEAWLRWREVVHANVTEPRAFLARIVTNLCLDQLTSARSRREQYVGQWLPEPLLDEQDGRNDPAAALELASDLSFALFQVLERLSPLERAAFVLHDVFDFEFETLAATLGRSEQACRQLAARARQHVRDARPRYRVSDEAATRLCAAFVQAIAARDLTELTRLLTADVVFVSDGGGVVAAVPRPLHGVDQVAQVILGFAKGYTLDTITTKFIRVNRTPAIALRERDGRLIQIILLEPSDDGRIAALYVQRNPQKLGHLG